MRRSCVITHPVVVNDGKPFELVNGLTLTVDLDCDGYDPSPWHNISLNLVLEGSLNEWGSNKEHCIGGCSKKENDTDVIKETIPPSVLFQLAQALNPPIKVTQAVLDAMEKVPEARFSMYVKYHTHRREIGKRYPLQYDEHYKVFHAFGVQGVQQLQIGDYIQASDGCPLALQVLLQFNEEGELFNV